MHNYNDELAYKHALRRLEALRQKAEWQRKLGAANVYESTYRTRLAHRLQRLANWLEPRPSKGDSYVSQYG